MTDFKAKMHQIRFRLGLRPRPRWGSLQRSPRPPSWIWGALLLRGGEERDRRGREGRGRRRGEGKGGEGKGGEGKENAMSPPLFGGSLRLWAKPGHTEPSDWSAAKKEWWWLSKQRVVMLNFVWTNHMCYRSFLFYCISNENWAKLMRHCQI